MAARGLADLAAARVREDHAAGDGLQHAEHGHGELLADPAARALDDDHRAVIQVPDTLTRLLPLLDQLHRQLLPRQHDRPHRRRELVHVQDADALQLGDAVQVVVVGEDRAAELLRERDELRVGLAHLGRIAVDDLDRQELLLLEAREELEAASPARAPQRIR